MKEMVGGCCVCSDDRGWTENPLVYCDGQGCTVAVHQACYGIVSVPSGNWYCRKCESPDRPPRAGPRQQHCELCPCKDGAIKRTDNNGWAHVVCALYIPEVRFGNVTTMEPIVLQHIPAERFNKSCYICEESGRGSRAAVGACMQCNKSGCKQTFHVTCAQALGLLCEEAGNYLDNVKYCGYCQHHYSKLKKGANVKTVPPYRPVSSDSPTSPDKDGEWSKPPGKRKLSTSGAKSSASTSAASSAPASGKPTSGKSSPPSAQESAPTASTEEPAPPSAPLPTPTATVDHPSADHAPPASAIGSNGKFTTSNFVESVVTPSASVFGDSSKPGKKRKSQAKEESPATTTATIVNPGGAAGSTTDEKRTKVEGSGTPSKPTEPPTPSVVVKLPSAAANPPPPPTTKLPPTTSTGSIVVSVPLAVASLAPAATPVSAPSAPPTAYAHSHGHALEDTPTKRGRSQSSDKTDKARKQKRGGSSTGSKRGGRSNQSSPPPPPTQPLAPPTPPIIATAPPSVPAPPQPTSAPTPVVMPVSQAMKDSPPSSPSPDAKLKHKKQQHSREDKDKLFQNGVSAPHMLGNQLNPASTMAQKMSDTLSQELEAHSIYSMEPNLSTGGQLVGPPLHNRVLAGVRDQTPPAQSWNNGTATMPQTLDQLLERQWEQGSQFLMEQAQHFDIASLLTCLHQLRAENLRLEEHVNSLLQRRDHLLAVNARLAIPLIPPAAPAPPPPPPPPQQPQPTVNNIHSGGGPGPQGQPPRVSNNYAPTENGPTSPGHPYQQNPSSRHHSPGSTAQSYACSAPGGVVRSTNQEPRRSSGPPVSSHSQQGYPSMYGQQPQMVMRRDVADLHHSIPSSKPS